MTGDAPRPYTLVAELTYRCPLRCVYCSNPLDYFRTRPPRARQDSLEAIDFVVRHADTYELQSRCVAALIRKTEILWHLLDSLYTAYVEPGWGPGGARA